MTPSTGQPTEDIELWRLETTGARALAADAERLDDLHTALRCCEQLLSELVPPPLGGDSRRVVIEALWGLALASYARCFGEHPAGGGLTEADVVAAVPEQEEVARWHQALLRLHEVYADPDANPRETFSTNLARDDDGRVVAIALTSATLPDVDSTSVHAAGGITLALSRMVEERMERAQELLMAEAAVLEPAVLDALDRWHTTPGPAPAAPPSSAAPQVPLN